MKHDVSTYRKQSIFSQQDIADMIGTYDAIQISRHELSDINPQMELVLLYYLLYKKSLAQFFPAHIESLKQRLRLRIPNIIDEWKFVKQNDTTKRKIECLEHFLSELNQPTP